MSVCKIEFEELEKINIREKTILDHLAPSIGVTYILAITRDGCSACDKQKPEFHELAKNMKHMYGDKVVFMNIHVKTRGGSNEESLRSKDMFNHYFYPSNLILLRTKDRGVIEYYRNVSPEIEELRKNIEIALKIVGMIKEEP